MKEIKSLNKGDIISTDDVSESLGLSSDSFKSLDMSDRNLLALKIAKDIERQLHKLGKRWTLQVQDGAIKVLTDSEALAYRKRQNKAGSRKIRRSLTGLEGVDVTQLSQAEKADHDRQIMKVSRQVQLLATVRLNPLELVKPANSEKLPRIKGWRTW